jgi:hypothetical protein
LAGFVLDIVEPSKISLILGYTGTIIAFVMACYALGYAALAPGVVTIHRVLGAIALYLNIGLMFGTIYALIWYFIPNSSGIFPAGRAGGLMERSSISTCHTDIDGLWRCHAGASGRPHTH